MTEPASSGLAGGGFDGLRAMYINCTLNRSPARSHTQGLVERSVALMERGGVEVDQIRAVDHDIAFGVRPPSYLDEGSGGPDNDFTNRNTTFMTYNLMHLATILRAVGGIPAYGNQRSEWEAGCHVDFENPEHR